MYGMRSEDNFKAKLNSQANQFQCKLLRHAYDFSIGFYLDDMFNFQSWTIAISVLFNILFHVSLQSQMKILFHSV